MTSSLYPIGDVLLLGILARLWTTPGARTTAFKLLAAASRLTLFGDAIYNFSALQGGGSARFARSTTCSGWAATC